MNPDDPVSTAAPQPEPAPPPAAPPAPVAAPGARRRGPLIVLAAILLGPVLGLVLGFGWLTAQWNGAGPATAPVPVIIAPGSSVGSAGKAMEAAGALESARIFALGARLLGGSRPIQAGEYEIPAGASPSDIHSMLQSGRTMQRFVVVPEGMPSVLVHERLMAAPHLTGEVPVPEEGSILPDSYSYQRGEARSAVLRRMQEAMRTELARLWAGRQPTSIVRSPQEAINLAAIIEKETAKPEERRRIAGVYTNRLRQGIPLAADPTVIYPVTRGRPLGRRILRSELQADNGYNTYVRAGLPNGPIANPGRASIAAALDPEQHDLLYFVADGTGGHVFARTLAEHNANVERWYAIRRARGEM